MNGELPNQTNFVVVDKKPVQIPPDKVIDESPTDEPVKQCSDNTVLNQREIVLIRKQRSKLRLMDPQGVYYFRHIPISYLHLVAQFISLCISLPLIYFYCRELNSESQQQISGVGYVSNWNVLDQLSIIFITIFSIVKLKALLTQKISSSGKRYKFAMLANGINRVVLNILKLFVMNFMMLVIYVLTFDTPIYFETILEQFENSALGDTISAANWFITIVIIVRAFKFFGKEVTE